MTLNKIFYSLRKRNKENYKQLQFCVMFAAFLVSSFISIVMNPAIQKALPPGGDSRKQVYMIFCIAVIGCFVFTIYAAGLFLRYKSHEIGIFLALGTEKKRLSKALYSDLGKIILTQSAIGIGAGMVMAFIALCIFKTAFPLSVDKVAFISLPGMAVPVLFCILAGVSIMVQARRFTKKSNIMDILNEQRKNEPLKDNIKSGYLIIGLVCLIAGILIAGVGAPIYTQYTKQSLGIWPSMFYLVSLFGLYRILIYSVIVHKRGKNPQKYYKNIISYGLLKFQGRSIVKNMLIISLLIICGLFACLYSPTKYILDQEAVRSNPVDFVFYYPLNADELEKEDIMELAEDFNVKIRNYHEAEFIRLLGSGVDRSDIDESGKLIEIYQKEHMYYSFLNESAYNKITGQNIEIEDGTYKLLINDVMYENIFYNFKDLDYVTNQYTDLKKEFKSAGTEKYGGLVNGRGVNGASRYVISDADYEVLSKGLPEEMRVRNILFGVEDIDNSYPFAKELYKKYCDSASENMLQMSAYDEHQEQLSLKEKGRYSYAGIIQPDPQHPEEQADWRYAPSFKILDMKNGFLSFAIFYMLFIYVTVICLAAAGIISYTRSMTVAVKNQKVFEDVKKLGANKEYLNGILTNQIKKVFVLPTVMGCLIMLLWFPLMLWQNDGILTGTEIIIIGVELLLCIAIAAYQLVIFKVSMKKAEKVVL